MPKYIHEVVESLRQEFDDFAHHNKADPLEELLFILCSLMTREKGYVASYQSLKSRFPTPMDIHAASAGEVREALETGGLSEQKSKSIKSILDTVQQKFGSLTLDPLRSWSDDECEEFLTSLPGVGLKAARCVMMYSLGRQVFPVDTHCWRVSHRLGWVRNMNRSKAVDHAAMNRLQEHIPKELRFSLHVNFVSLGRTCCRSISPKCGECPISAYCKKICVSPRREHR